MITTVLTNLNHGNYLQQSLASIFSQKDYSIEDEVIVVDGGSTDNSLQIIDEFPRVKLIYKEDKSAADAVRLGILNASNDFIYFTTSTDFLHDTSFFTLAKSIFLEMPEISCIHSSRLYFKDSKLNKIDFFGKRKKFKSHKNLFTHWLFTTETFYEVLTIFRKDVVLKCLDLQDYNLPFNQIKRDLYYELRYQFMSNGFISHHLPIYAAAVRDHENRLQEDKIFHIQLQSYQARVNSFKKSSRKKGIWS